MKSAMAPVHFMSLSLGCFRKFNPTGKSTATIGLLKSEPRQSIIRLAYGLSNGSIDGPDQACSLPHGGAPASACTALDLGA